MSLFRPVLLALLLALGVGAAQGAGGQDPYTHFFGQSLGDFREELQLARDQGKTGVLIFFEMDECPWCHRMKSAVLNRPDVQAYYREHFLSFPVDIEGDVEIVDFEGNTTTMKDWAFKVHRVRATPVFAFFDLEGKRVAHYVGATNDADEFMLLGRYVVDGVYKQGVSFTRYKREHQKAPGN